MRTQERLFSGDRRAMPATARLGLGRPPEAPIYGCPRFWGFEGPKSAQSLSEFWGFEGPGRKICPRLVRFWGFETDLGCFGPCPWSQNKSKINVNYGVLPGPTRHHPPNFKQ